MWARERSRCTTYHVLWCSFAEDVDRFVLFLPVVLSPQPVNSTVDAGWGKSPPVASNQATKQPAFLVFFLASWKSDEK